MLHIVAVTVSTVGSVAGGVLDRLAHHARGVLAMERVCILICSGGDAAASMIPVAGAGTAGGRFPRRPRALARHAVRLARPVVAPDGDELACAAPIRTGSGVCGALWASARREGPPREAGLAPRELELLSEIALLAGEAAVHHERPEPAPPDAGPRVQALLRALASADGGTLRHSLEVCTIAGDVARRLGLGGPDLVEVELGALLHDAGKLRVPPEILRKPGRLSPEEHALVRRHAEWGAELVGRIAGLEAVALVVRLHHERPDGAGYPHALPGERIPLASRIIAACDAYGAMTGGRPYRDPLEPHEAIDELRRGAGSQFDPLVTETLVAALDRKRPRIAAG